MNKTDIEWADYTWNPVTGCLHDCPYCYARNIARRFKGTGDLREDRTGFYLEESRFEVSPGIYETRYPLTRGHKPEPLSPYTGTKTPYPFGFAPTLHSYRLGEPAAHKRPQRVFVCSMADLFGEWVPDEWIKAVFDACAAAPWHRYLFLTKNPKRYRKLKSKGMLPRRENTWYGSTITTDMDAYFFDEMSGSKYNRFLSIEPILKPFHPHGDVFTDWVIIGAETGNRKGKVIPRPEWVADIADQCAAAGIPVFMKNSLIPIVDEEKMLRQWPQGLEGVNETTRSKTTT